MTDTREAVGRIVMEEAVCGLTVEGERVFCDDPRLDGHDDGYGKPLRRKECECKATGSRIFAEHIAPLESELARLREALAVAERDNVKLKARNELVERDNKLYRALDWRGRAVAAESRASAAEEHARALYMMLVARPDIAHALHTMPGPAERQVIEAAREFLNKVRNHE